MPAQRTLASRVIAWQRRDGRNDLPWQNTRDPYRIWLSEIMLQQTQVSAVIPYYERFLARFPDVAALAVADVDEVMKYWAGLGYYARARNLHRTAKMIVDDHGGLFPRDIADIRQLPGIGRSTAAAIAAFAFSARAAILDGNVKRVFARYFGIHGDIKTKAVEDRLWKIAEEQLPASDMGRYTQGLMDIGATVCTRNNPQCLLCPLAGQCVARAGGLTGQLPGRAAKRETPHRHTRMLIVVSAGCVLLEKRPPAGIWGGLWSLPECPLDDDVAQFLRQRYGLKAQSIAELGPVEHGFTHYSLTIHPLHIQCGRATTLAMQGDTTWMVWGEAVDGAIPAPVKRILAGLGGD